MLGCPGLLITLFLPCLALYKHSNHSFYQCPLPFFITQTFPLTPGLPRGGGGEWGQNNLTGALWSDEQNVLSHWGTVCQLTPVYIDLSKYF